MLVQDMLHFQGTKQHIFVSQALSPIYNEKLIFRSNKTNLCVLISCFVNFKKKWTVYCLLLHTNFVDIEFFSHFRRFRAMKEPTSRNRTITQQNLSVLLISQECESNQCAVVKEKTKFNTKHEPQKPPKNTITIYIKNTITI